MHELSFDIPPTQEIILEAVRTFRQEAANNGSIFSELTFSASGIVHPYKTHIPGFEDSHDQRQRYVKECLEHGVMPFWTPVLVAEGSGFREKTDPCMANGSIDFQRKDEEIYKQVMKALPLGGRPQLITYKGGLNHLMETVLDDLLTNYVLQRGMLQTGGTSRGWDHTVEFVDYGMRYGGFMGVRHRLSATPEYVSRINEWFEALKIKNNNSDIQLAFAR